MWKILGLLLVIGVIGSGLILLILQLTGSL